MTAHDPLPCEAAELLRHEQWLRALARSLVHGVDVDDLVQETWVAAIARQPDGDRPLRGWLRTVAERLAARHHRSAARRARREQLVAPPDELPSTEATVAMLEQQRRVSAAAAALPEPYRTAILLRYLHGQSHAAIAARTHTNEATARKRVERGLEQLRAQLRRDDPAWKRAPAMLAFAGAAPPLLPPLLGILAMSQAAKITSAAIVLALLAGIGWWLAPTAAAPALTPHDAAPAALAQASVPASASSATQPTTARIEANAPPAAAAAPAEVCRGRVLDLRGQPLAGVPLVAVKRWTPERADAATAAQRDRLPAEVQALAGREPEAGVTDLAALPEVARTGADGSFELVPRDGFLFAGSGWTTLRASATGSVAGRDARLLVVAPAVEVRGEVVSDQGPVAGVRIAAEWPLLASFPESLDSTLKVPTPIARSAGDGTFTIAGLPAGEGRISFHRDGYEPATLAVPAANASGVRIVLRRIDDASLLVTGSVVDHRMVPVAGARVGLQGLAATTDAAGRFRLVYRAGEPAPVASSELFAASPGYQTLVVPRFGARLADPAQRDVVLQLAGPALSISGTVVDAAGKPIADALVYPWNEPELLEDRTADELGMATDAPVAAVGPGIRVFARTGADGAFELGGLRARDYRLHVLLTKPRAGHTSEPLAAGQAGVRLQLPEKLCHERVAGRVVDRAGQPVGEVTVGASMTIYRSGYSSHGDGGSSVTTDAEGRFELHDVPCADVVLTVNGPSIVHHRIALDTLLAASSQDVVVKRRHHLRIDADPARGATAFRVYDAAGAPQSVTELSGGSSLSRDRWPLHDGKSGVLAVGDDVVTVALERDGTELVRLPVRLVAGDVTIVRY